MSNNYEPDFIERNGTWLLSVFGILGSCLTGMTVYFLKSRCSNIKICWGCVDCIRQPLPVPSVSQPVPPPPPSSPSTPQVSAAAPVHQPIEMDLA